MTIIKDVWVVREKYTSENGSPVIGVYDNHDAAVNRRNMVALSTIEKEKGVVDGKNIHIISFTTTFNQAEESTFEKLSRLFKKPAVDLTTEELQFIIDNKDDYV